MKMISLEEELKGNAYPGRGIVIGKSQDGKKAVTAYFIMGRSVNSRNRVFAETEDGIRTCLLYTSNHKRQILTQYELQCALAELLLVIMLRVATHIIKEIICP